ncbi:uncharacterized protein LOC116774060 [Danaus plexippus]|uniref:Uncharacterized protein n=1 Tax=Danaus plexippus plexippus TaxID=278856 RepID=A0A212EQW9_DANPL|nr:uncharacterized protein LOC116774060 [Danaus plexippus]OWR43892.1 hypothetical protein KGM_215174 [Danaus plexippus plexippus]
MTSISLEFIQDLLKKDYPDVKIQEMEGAPGSKRGDNYTSMVYRVTLRGVRQRTDQDEKTEIYEAWEGSIMYKCLPESILRREAFKSDELFCNEVAFYNKIWPAFTNFQSQWEKVTDPLDCIPKCYWAQNDMVILEDLKQLGYVMPDRRKGLTIDQCYYVLKQLSHFHALSLAMKYYDPEGFYDLVNIQDGISEVFFLPENEEYYRNYYKEAIRNAIAMVEEELKESSDRDKYLEPFRRFCSEETFFQSMVDMVAPREPLAVICHGDCWTNNFLFKVENGQIEGMYIVDFQLARYASPGLDLALLLYLCLERAQRSQHLSDLLRYYSDNLHSTLTLMNGDTLDKETLFDIVQEEFRSSSRFGLGLALDMCPIMTCDSDEAPNLYQAKESESSPEACVRPVMTTNAACRRKMTDLVRELVDNQLL